MLLRFRLNQLLGKLNQNMDLYQRFEAVTRRNHEKTMLIYPNPSAKTYFLLIQFQFLLLHPYPTPSTNIEVINVYNTLLDLMVHFHPTHPTNGYFLDIDIQRKLQLRELALCKIIIEQVRKNYKLNYGTKHYAMSQVMKSQAMLLYLGQKPR